MKFGISAQAKQPDQWMLGVLWVLSVALFLWNFGALAQEIALENRGATGLAEVSNWRVSEKPTRHGTLKTYEVYYTLTLPQETIEDWAHLSLSDWEATQKNPQLEIVYLQSRPSNHRAALSADGVYGGPITGMVISGLLSALLWKALRLNQPKS